MQCKGVLLREKLRVVVKVGNPGAVATMLRHLGLDQAPNPEATTVVNECGPLLELVFDFGARTIRPHAAHRCE